jgi:antitoxin component of RelBE/YafQ-DinJ toxin-antitoxin module
MMPDKNDSLLNLRIDRELREQFKRACFKKGETQSEAIKKFIRAYVRGDL